MDVPKTLFAPTRDGLSIAYQVSGDGPEDILLLPSLMSIDAMWDDPCYARVLNRLARMGRLVCMDLRGCGASDPIPLGPVPAIEDWTTDITAVLDAVGSVGATLIGDAFLGRFATVFAATYPQRTNRLVLVDTSAYIRRADDYPIGLPPHVVDLAVQRILGAWGTEAMATMFVPSRADDVVFRRWLARFTRSACSPAGMAAILRWDFDVDVRHILPAVRVPTLVLHEERGAFRPEHGRYLADRIPGARFVLLAGGGEGFLLVREA